MNREDPVPGLPLESVMGNAKQYKMLPPVEPATLIDAAMSSRSEQEEIADDLGINTDDLKRQITILQDQQGVITQFRSLRNLKLTALQAKILSYITDDVIEDASLRDLIAAIKMLHSMETAEKGHGQVKGLLKHLLEMEREELALQERIDKLESDIPDGEFTVHTPEDDLPRL